MRRSVYFKLFIGVSILSLALMGADNGCGKRDDNRPPQCINGVSPSSPDCLKECRGNRDCGAGEMCDFEVCVNTCLDDDPVCVNTCIGVCVPHDCVCPDVYAPVCGVDGVTYGNRCEARCAGVEVAHEGECRDHRCFSDQDCPEGTHCNAADICLPPPGCETGEGCPAVCTGFCVPDDCICPAIYDPVCGVDGVTYGNACEARCAGVEIAHEGECRDECRDNADCPDDLICFPPTKTCQPRCAVDCLVCEPVCGEDGNTYCCGEADAHCNGVEVAHPGQCDCICPAIFAPVCGVDGVTYDNACFAECAGAEIAHEGECRDECKSNADCDGDLICYPPTKMCQPECQIACFRFDPVCGTDGVTYGCGEQDAWCHGVEVAHEGECRDDRCFGDQDCPEGTHCNAADICLPPPGCEPGDICPAVCTGFCVPDDCICPAIFDPVCGVDGVTYGNACEARCAGVEVAHEGECGGLCAELGVPMDICPLVLCAPEGGDPVCGVDGNTYPNACMACCGAGVEIEHPGECQGDCPPLPCDVFCEFGHKLGPDGCPTCECNEPCLCTEEYQPVCGVDGVTYSNACFAECAGVDIAHEGECECTPVFCEIFCEFGFKQGPDGCEICECNPGPTR